MFQRVQTLYFFAAFALSVFFGLTYNSFLPAGEYVDVVGILSGIAAGIVLVATFLYNDRSKQMNFAKAARWASLGWLAFLIFLVYRDNVVQNLFESGSAVKILYLAIPILFYVFVSSGLKAIQSDIELIKSADRIR